jgi:SOS response regulatory protein OraA/RecX
MSSVKKKPLIFKRNPPVTPLQDEQRATLALQRAKSNVAESTPNERMLRAISNSGLNIRDDGTFVTERPLLWYIRTLSKEAKTPEELYQKLSEKYLDEPTRKVFLANLQKEGIIDKPKKGWMDAMSYARKVAELEKQGEVASPEREIGTGDGFKIFKQNIGPRIKQEMGYRGKPRREGVAGRISRFFNKKTVTNLEDQEIADRWTSLPANAKEIFRTKKLKNAISTSNITKREEASIIQVADEYDGEIPSGFFDELSTEQSTQIESVLTDPEYQAQKFSNDIAEAQRHERNKIAVTADMEELVEELVNAGIEEADIKQLMKDFPQVPTMKMKIQKGMDDDLLVEEATPARKEDELLTREGFEEEDMPPLESDKLRSRSRISRLNEKTSADTTIKRSVMNASVIQENEANSTLSKLASTGMARRGINVGTSAARAIGEMGTFGAIVGSTFVFSGENSTVFALGTTVTGIAYGAFGIGVGAPTAGLGGVAVFLTGPVVSISGGLASVLVYQTGKTLYMQTKLHDFDKRDKKNNTTTFYSLRRQTFVSVPNDLVKKFRLSNNRLVLHAIFNGERLYRLAKE